MKMNTKTFFCVEQIGVTEVQRLPWNGRRFRVYTV